MAKLTPEQKEEQRQKLIRQRRKKLQDLERWYRHQEDGPLVGWPDQAVLDARHKRNQILLSIAPFLVAAASYALHFFLHH